jgi:solute:Na+ symporter, SSS family
LSVLHVIRETNGKILFFYSMILSISAYVLVSLLGSKKEFNIDEMLHRGKYKTKSDDAKAAPPPTRGLKALGITNEFTFGDKFIYFATIAWMLGWWIVFLIGTAYNLTTDVSVDSWIKFWRVKIYIYLALGFITMVWFTAGGIRDIIDMFKTLRTAKRNFEDDGRVVGHHNVGEDITENDM